MRILVAGATGFIGRRLVDALVREGHQVVAASRTPAARGPGALAVDYAEVPDAEWWAPHLRGVDVLVNAVGIFREEGRQRFDALHLHAPVALFSAAARARVRLVIQLSAHGSDQAARTRYHLSKRAADDALRRLPVVSAIVQPSLIYAPDGASAGLFHQLAMLPLVALSARIAVLQPVHVDDVIEGLLALVRHPPSKSRTLSFVGPRALSLRQYVEALRQAMGSTRRPWVLRLPSHLFMAAGSFVGRLPGGSLVDRDAVRMLLHRNAADPRGFAELLSRPPRPPEEFLTPAQAPAVRREGLLRSMLPVLALSIAAVWIWTALVSLGLLSMGGAATLERDFGLQGAAAGLALYGAAALDLALGLSVFAVRPRWRRYLWGTQLAVLGFYTVLVTVQAADWWLHPLGPMVKNLPMAAGIGLLWAMEPVRRRGLRR